MLLQILTYTHHLTTMLFGIFLSAFFLGVKQNKKNVCILLGGGAVSGLFFLICNTVFGSLFTEDRKSTRLNSSHANESRMPSSA